MYHIERTKELTGADTVVIAMSGSFVQRGEPAMLDKYTRTRMALECGADLVLELPAVFACGSAEQFALGGISLLDGLGCIDRLSFGSEEGTTELLEKAASVYAEEDDRFKAILRGRLDQKLPYPAAMTEACIEYLGCGEAEREALRKPNNILAVEYLKQLRLLGSKTAPVTVKREGSGYNESNLTEEKPSAAAIRGALEKNVDFSSVSAHIPDECAEVLKEIKGNVKLELNDFYEMIAYKILSETEEKLEAVYGADEGLTNKLKAEIRYAKDLDELSERVLSKRYTRTRLNRLYVRLLLDVTKKEHEAFGRGGTAYARVLGLTERGGRLLRRIKKDELASIPVLTNVNKEQSVLSPAGRWQLGIDIRANDICNLAAGRDLYANSDYVREVIRRF